MSKTSEGSSAYSHGGLMAAPWPARAAGGGAFISAGAILLGSLLTGLAGGLVWSAVAPRPVYVVSSQGSAYVVNPETSAFITGDLSYCLIGAVGGVIIGIAAYLLAIRKYGPVPMIAVAGGSVLAGLLARWVGQDLGLGQFNSQLANSKIGTLLHAPPVLGANGPQILWPAVAFWPLAACAVPAVILLLAAWRDRSGRAAGLPSWPA
jgi:hypothetical protein